MTGQLEVLVIVAAILLAAWAVETLVDAWRGGRPP
jgi:hypothetical protein